MEYEDFIRAVSELDFIHDEEEADSAVKAALGILASRLDEDEARKLTEYLPNPLSYEKLRGHQLTDTDISAEEFISEIADQFNLDEDQAQELINTVLQIAKEAIGYDTIVELEQHLPEDWAEVFENA
jgi:uncharacterized protein (DUF2267 family)